MSMADHDPTRPLVVDGPVPFVAADAPVRPHTTGSLSRRMIGIAAGWILLLLMGGGFALDRVLVTAITLNFDDQLEYVLTSLITSAEIGPIGEVTNTRELADQRFLEPGSGLYYQSQRAGAGNLSFALALGPPARLWQRAPRPRCAPLRQRPIRGQDPAPCAGARRSGRRAEP